MADDIIIDVKIDTAKAAQALADASANVAKLREEQSRLTKEIKAGNDTNGENTAQLEKVKQALSAAQREMKAHTAQLAIADDTRKKENLTLNEQRALLAQAQAALGAYTKEEIQNTEEGRKLYEQTKALSDQVKETEQGFGDARRNVGNYKEALEQAGGGVGEFTKKLKALMLNPWAALIGAIVVAFRALINAFKSSEDRMREVQTAFAPFEGVINTGKQALDAFAKVVSGVVVEALDKLGGAVSWVIKQVDKIGRAFGQDWGLEERVEENRRAAAEIVRVEQELVDKKRAFALQEAKNNTEVSELRAKAAEKDKYTDYQRLAFLEQAKEIELQTSNEREKIARQELQLAQLKAAQSENDAAANEDLIAKQVAVIEATRATNDKMRELNGTIAELTKTTVEYAAVQASGGVFLSDEEVEHIVQNYATVGNAVAATMEQLQAEFGTGDLEREEEEEESVPTPEEVAARLGLTSDGLQLYRDLLAQGMDSNAAFDEAIRASEEQLAAEHKQRVQIMADATGMLSNSFGALSNAFAQYGKESKAAAIASKAFGMAQIITSQAQSIANGALAISEGIASAAAVPFPANIPAIIAIVAQIGGLIAGVASSISQAKQVINGGNFATGGIVPGESYTGDKVVAHVNSGEMILNPSQQSQLFNIATGREGAAAIDYERMQSAFATALQNMPAPVLVYEEFQTFENDRQTNIRLSEIGG